MPVREGVILGLAEVGGGAVEPDIRRHLDHPRATLRAAALAACAIVASGDLAERVAAALADPAPRPRRVARDLVRARKVNLPLAVVWAAYLRAAPDARGAALAVLAAGDYWSRLPYLLRADARAHVQAWLDRRVRVFTRPTPAAVAAVEEALREVAIDAEVASAIRHALR